MEDKKLLTNEELEKVAGGSDTLAELTDDELAQVTGGMRRATITPGLKCPGCGQDTMVEDKLITDVGEFITLTCQCGYREEHNTFFDKPGW